MSFPLFFPEGAPLPRAHLAAFHTHAVVLYLPALCGRMVISLTVPTQCILLESINIEFSFLQVEDRGECGLHNSG